LPHHCVVSVGTGAPSCDAVLDRRARRARHDAVWRISPSPGLRGQAVVCYAWLIFVFAEQAIAQLGGDYRLIGIAASLTGLWIVIRASALLLRDPLLARAVAAIAWIIAALGILGYCRRPRWRSTIWR
jgi:hypothetical protein